MTGRLLATPQKEIARALGVTPARISQRLSGLRAGWTAFQEAAGVTAVA